MVYLQFLLGVGVVIVAAATAIYFSMPERQTPHRPHSGRRPNDANRNESSYKRDQKERRVPNSKPGDKCILCLNDMKADTMHTMICGHAICNAPCYLEYRKWRRHCPYCEQIVFQFTQPGDDCSICSEPLVDDGRMWYLKCEHALHSSCLDEYEKKGYRTCPLCKQSL